MTWTPIPKQSETWTARVRPVRGFDPDGFDRTPRFDTGTTSGLWNREPTQAETWVSE
jgi:hypothetical protein